MNICPSHTSDFTVFSSSLRHSPLPCTWCAAVSSQFFHLCDSCTNTAAFPFSHSPFCSLASFLDHHRGLISLRVTRQAVYCHFWWAVRVPGLNFNEEKKSTGPLSAQRLSSTRQKGKTAVNCLGNNNVSKTLARRDQHEPDSSSLWSHHRVAEWQTNL